MATVLYARVSTAEQTIEHQLEHAKAVGFAIDEVVADNGGPLKIQDQKHKDVKYDVIAREGYTAKHTVE